MSRMRRSLRFFRSCSSSSLIFIGISFFPFIEHEVIASDAVQDHAFEPVQVVEAVTGRLRYSRDHGWTRIFADNPQQLAQGKGEIAVSAFFKGGQIIGQFWSGLKDRLFFGMRVCAFNALTARRAVFG